MGDAIGVEMDELGRDEREIEGELRGLKPPVLNELQEARVMMGVEREEQRVAMRRVIWGRLVPIGAVAAVLMAGVFVMLRGGADDEVVEVSAAQDGDFWGRLEPVEAQNVLRDTSEGEIVFVSEGSLMPYREVYLDYEDAYRWRDPVTATELTVYQPRREVRYVPVMIY